MYPAGSNFRAQADLNKFHNLISNLATNSDHRLTIDCEKAFCKSPEKDHRERELVLQ